MENIELEIIDVEFTCSKTKYRLQGVGTKKTQLNIIALGNLAQGNGYAMNRGVLECVLLRALIVC